VELAAAIGLVGRNLGQLVARRARR
jgi:hypothetical protein